ncbi:MAG: DUF1854 domain-containing protein [Candidatus Omnitrophica bacterium]|nr:DUF1854 domain-containing protein [Candidatus Omnitrophota bacterium]
MAESRLEQIELQILKPEDIKIFRGTFNLMHLMTKNGELYRGVSAVRAFPATYPDKFISLFYYDEKDRIKEIGLIEDIKVFPEDVREIIFHVMRKYYFSYTVLKIYSIKMEYGNLYFEVETDKGPKSFAMRRAAHRTIDYGESGKILLDVFDDRYVIPDVEEMDKIDRELFTRYIYW